MIEIIESFGHTRNQYLASFCVNLLVFAYGAGLGWFSPALPLLLSPETPLASGPLSTEQLSFAGSVISLGSLAGCLLAGYGAVKVGTKQTSLILVIPQLISWLLLIFGPYVECIILARFLSGMTGGGIQTSTTLYFAEIADDNIRGKLSMSYSLSRNTGILFAYVAGIYINYMHLSIIGAMICVIFVTSYCGLPSTPKYLLQIGADHKARNALKFYKGCAKDDENPNLVKAFERMQTISMESKEDSKLKWSDLFEPIARKGILIGIVLTILSQSCGTCVFITYASMIFAEYGANYSAEWSAIALALLQIVGTLFAARFVETQGRKPLLITSLVGCKIGLLSMAAYLYSETLDYDVSIFNWVPVVSLSFVIFISYVGVIPLSLICLVEALPTKVRSLGLTLGTVSMNSAAFVIVATYPIMLEVVDLHGCMIFYALTCLFGLFFVMFVMEETKGKTLDLLNAEKKSSTEA